MRFLQKKNGLKQYDWSICNKRWKNELWDKWENKTGNLKWKFIFSLTMFGTELICILWQPINDLDEHKNFPALFNWE